jgi:hypothetical protein
VRYGCLKESEWNPQYPRRVARLPKQRQAKAIWQKTAAMLMEAHGSGKADDLEHATGQLRRALDAEGWAA